MITFLIKGLIRDRSRSLFPLLVISAGVAICVLADAWVTGVFSDIIETNAKFQAGHVKVLTRSYAEQQQQYPIDLSLTDTNHWLEKLRQEYPSVNWQLRIYFGGLLDFPDEQGETLSQGPVAGMGVDLLSEESKEREYLNLENALVKGKLPEQPGEILVTDSFFKKLNLSLGQKATLISSGMDGGMAVYNFTVVGTINFGVTGLDRGAIIAHVHDVQDALNMFDATTEIFGYFKSGRYLIEQSEAIAQHFNQNYTNHDDPFSPIMRTFSQGEMGQNLSLFGNVTGIVITVFIFIMSVVLWNTGIMSGIRRYGEMGVRLAMGESGGHIYLTLLGEALIIGIVGSIIGTLLALFPAYYLQEVGFDISDVLVGNDVSILMSTVMRAHITTSTFWIGLIPGVIATFIGTLISGFAIFRRQTADLFKELEV